MKIRFRYCYFWLFLLTALLAGCVTQAPVEEDSITPAPEDVSKPEIQGGSQSENHSEWSIALKGVRTDTLEDAKAHNFHYVEMKLKKRGTVTNYLGMPLYRIVAMVDGTEARHPYTFDRSLWESGYDITITSKDGYSVTFNTADIHSQAMILADSADGRAVAPRIVGDVPGNLWVEDVAEIELALGGEVIVERPFELIMDINGNISSLTLDELEVSPYYIEDKGSYTTSAGTTYTAIWGGVKMPEFLGRFMNLRKDSSITFTAMDGYEMTYSGEQILDRSDGVWILAFKMDGEYIPKDPGYIRIIKVGPKNPNIDGHSSVRMVEKIVVKEEDYRDFTLDIQGKMNFTLDRQTVQSGLSCHKKTVHFERKGESSLYTGIPLYLLLAFSDDPSYAPHKQDKSILSYQKELAQKGYKVEIEAADGFKITLDSKELDGNEDVIIAMYKEGEELPDREFPLILVWDKDAARVPDGIKPVRCISAIRLIF